jgi:hypothetical protein
LKRKLRPLLLIVVLVFVGYAMRDVARRWDGSHVKFLTLPLALAFLPLCAGCLVQAWGWIGLIERMAGKPVPGLRALALYMDSQLARYSPGMVGLPIVRMAGADRVDVPPATVGTSIGLEMLSWTAVGGMIGFASLFWLPQKQGLVALLGRFAMPIVATFSLGALLLLAVDRRWFPSLVVRSLRLQGVGPLIPLRLTLSHVFYWATWMLHGGLLSLALGGSVSTALACSGAFVLAGVGGFVALAAPAGAGVREGIVTLTLSPVLGAPAAVAAAVASRALSLAADLTVWGLLRLRVKREH